jgi:hypothetical protein
MGHLPNCEPGGDEPTLAVIPSHPERLPMTESPVPAGGPSADGTPPEPVSREEDEPITAGPIPPDDEYEPV